MLSFKIAEVMCLIPFKLCVNVQVGNIRGHGGPINKLTFSPSGQELITASDDHKIKVSSLWQVGLT